MDRNEGTWEQESVTDLTLDDDDDNDDIMSGIGDRLIWCDALLDKIESSDTLGQDRRILLDATHGVLHPIDMIMYQGTLMWTELVFQGIGVQEGDQQAWPRVYTNTAIIAKPGGIHVVGENCVFPHTIGNWRTD